MIDNLDIECRRLAALSSPQRIAWLRQRVSGYVVDLGARAYFRLPTYCAGAEVENPKDEARGACFHLGTIHGFAEEECVAAFASEWKSAMNLAVQAGEKLKITALSHLKLTRDPSGVLQALLNAKPKFPASWPYLTDDDLGLIAAGFRRPAKRRAA